MCIYAEREGDSEAERVRRMRKKEWKTEWKKEWKNERQKECETKRKTECKPMVLLRIVIHSPHHERRARIDLDYLKIVLKWTAENIW